MAEQTLALVKPDAVSDGYLRPILIRLRRAGFEVARQQYVRLTRAQAEIFYAPRRGRPEFDHLVSSIAGGMMVALLLEREDAVSQWLTLAGHPSPREAAPGTIRRDFARHGLAGEPVVHAPQSAADALRETSFLFNARDSVKGLVAVTDKP